MHSMEFASPASTWLQCRQVQNSKLVIQDFPYIQREKLVNFLSLTYGIEPAPGANFNWDKKFFRSIYFILLIIWKGPELVAQKTSLLLRGIPSILIYVKTMMQLTKP